VRLERAREEIAAAETLAAAGFERQAVSRAYYAAFYAAEAALLALGETRSKHAGVLSAFGRLVVKDGGMNPDIGRVLRRLFELRHVADYGPPDERVPANVDAVADALRVVDAVEAWISGRV
jgi:uncharacterized protein (UPF0332 family)